MQPSADLMSLVPIPPAGTGPRRPTSNGVRGVRCSATGIATTSRRAISRPSGVCAKGPSGDERNSTLHRPRGAPPQKQGTKSMTHPSSTVKDFSSSRGDRRIRVLIEEFKGFAPTTFSETEVERVVGLGEEHSALVLRSGVKIPVALSFEQLEQKIYEPDFHTDGPVLDLRTVTGEV